MKRKQFVVFVVVAVVATFVCLTAVCGEKKEKETGKDTVADNAKKNGPEAPIVLPKKITNAIGMEFVYIEPTGPNGFTMGSNNGDSDEKPPHKVVLTKGFYLQTTEVTQKQWKAVMGANPSHFKGDNLPVQNVSWNDAQKFIKKLNEKEGTNKCRLPTEAEWEYACRGGTKTAYYSGDRMGGEYWWYVSNSSSQTRPVGTREPNAWGLYDMSGNVWEWCQDWYEEDYYEHSPEKDPQGPPNGEYRVLRGGSWYDYPWLCRSANRFGNNPDYADFYFGFRIARTPE